jgi:carbonic anhydrase
MGLKAQAGAATGRYPSEEPLAMSRCLSVRFAALPLPLLLACTLWPALALAADGHGHAPLNPASPAAKTATHAKAAPLAKPDEVVSTLASAAPTVEGAVDPLDRLRQRLADRLAGARAPDGTASNDLRVVVKTPAPATASMRVAPKVTRGNGKAALSRDAPGMHGTPGAAAAHAAHWAYSGDGGPQAWSQLKPEFNLCGTGQRQSPIDIRAGLVVELEPVRFDYQPSRFAVVDNGHTVQVNLQPGNAIEVGGKRFELVQFHFHRPSEERIDGKQFEMSLHLVHKDEQGRLAVVALLIDKGARQPVLQKVWNNLPLEKNQEASARAPLELLDLLPDDRRYFTYMGSLTTPPCSEGVQWIVMRQPVTAAPEQIELFSRIYPMNARPLQSAAGRRIMQSQ